MESGVGASGPPDEVGGLIVMVRADPTRAARAIATDLGADLAVGGAHAERALAELADRRRHRHDLDDLSQAMRRAEQVRADTRTEVAGRVSTALNTKVAIHPDTVRRAATEYEASRLALDQAVARDHRRRRTATAAWGAAATVMALAAAALVLVDLAIAGAVVAAVASALVVTWGRRSTRTVPADHAGLHRHLEVARSRWEQVAGRGADPTDVDDVVRRYDPHDGVVARLVEESPAVRAADRVALQRRMAWVSAWRTEVGDHAPIADPNAAELLRHAQAQLWLTGVHGLSRTNPDTLVVASPYEGLAGERARDLHRQLLGIPRSFRIIVVLPPDPSDATDVRDQVVGTGEWAPGGLGAPSVS